MSVKYYCDNCSEEVKADDLKRIKRILNSKIMVEVIVGVGRTWNAGQVCRKCVIEAVTEGRDMADHEYTQSHEREDD